jgi:hypothetical protein
VVCVEQIRHTWASNRMVSVLRFALRIRSTPFDDADKREHGGSMCSGISFASASGISSRVGTDSCCVDTVTRVGHSDVHRAFLTELH